MLHNTDTCQTTKSGLTHTVFGKLTVIDCIAVANVCLELTQLSNHDLIALWAYGRFYCRNSEARL